MTANWEVFTRDPRDWQIPNQGVTKVGTPKDIGDWEVLKWELESFVCEGEYARGLERILSAYLSGLSRPEQTAAWVSGFYGSGKSQLTRMLAELWVNRELPSGQSARSLATLSEGVSDEFIELDNAGKRNGGLWAATGKLGSGVTESYRLAFMSVLFDSAGLPTQYPAARFAIKLKEEGVYDDVVADLESAGKDPRREFLQMYVSKPLHEAVLKHLPELAPDPGELSKLLRAEYPRVDDITDDELRIVMRQVLESQSTEPGQIPHTVIVLDEIQQYVGNDSDRLDHLQNITELVSSSFDSKVMVVATGQLALAGSSTLSKIQHRFPTRVELSDKDVEQVTRELVLRKRPEELSGLEASLDAVRGEIDRHLTSSRIGAKPQDADNLAFDYPILPVRRRLWEKILRAIDVSGGAGQLRTQLRMTHEANQTTAHYDVPNVVGADYIYFDQMQGMLSGGVLSLDMYQRIIDFDDGTSEGELRQRVLALVFMLSQLPREAGADIEVRANADTIAELLVTDLVSGTGQLKPDVDAAVQALVAEGALVELDGEFVLQTPAGAELQRKFREQTQRVRGSAPEMSNLRNEALKAGVNRELGNLSKIQGRSAVSRKIAVSVGGDRPDATGTVIPVWVQSEWSTSGKSVEDAARTGGVNDPTVYVFLPKEAAAEFDDALASSKASALVLASQPAAQTPESQDARRSLEAHRQIAETDSAKRVGEILNRATVRQGGGSVVDGAGSLRGNVDLALDASLKRKFPRFSEGDHPDWPKVAKQAREGSTTALEAVGHHGEPTAHPVTSSILQYLTGSKTGAQVRDEFTAGDYGWPRDTVDGALLSLVASGRAKARDRTQRAVDAAAIKTPDIPSTTFEPESEVVSGSDKLKLKALLSDLSVTVDGSGYNEGLGRLSERFEQASSRIVGSPPLPEKLDLSAMLEVMNVSGNEAIRAALDNESELRALHDKVTALDGLVPKRRAQWDTLQRLLRHAEGTDIAAGHTDAIDAILDNRRILDSPDPAAPILQGYVEGFREAIVSKQQQLADAVEVARSRVEAMPDAAEVGDAVVEGILARNQLAMPIERPLSSEAGVLAALDARPLSAWDDIIEAVPARESNAMAEIAQSATPSFEVVAVKLPSRVITSPADIEAFLSDARDLFEEKLAEGKHPSV